MFVKTEIEKALGAPIAVGAIDGVDYQCNIAFAIAKRENKLPFEVASEICEKKSAVLGGICTLSAHQSGFINIKLNEKVLNNFADEVLKIGALPIEKQKSKVVFFDYGGANIAKQLHIGHLRSPIIGEALKRVYKILGHKTIADTHFGDWGLQIGLVLAWLETEKNPPENPLNNPPEKGGQNPPKITLELLNEVYPNASKRSKEDPEFYALASKITAELQKKREPYFSKWREMRAVSVASIMDCYKMLGCTFDLQNGESDAEPFIAKTIEIMKKHGAVESEGCLVIDVKTEADTRPMPPVILQKSGGGDLYATTDLATMLDRQKEYKPDKYIYVADFRQELHFEQVFRASKIAGIVPKDTELTHVSFGTMNGRDGKPFKTRSGDTVNLHEVIDMVTSSASERIVQNGRIATPEVARKIGLSALKFADLMNTVRKDYVFDLDKFTSFEGKTGPYVLYTIARINSILKQKSAPATKLVSCGTPPKKEIVLACLRLADNYPAVIETNSLNGVVDAMYNLAQKFNALYASETIAGNAENEKTARLVRTVLMFAMNSLAIECVDEM